MKNLTKKIFLFLAGILLLVCTAQAQIRYVKPTATGLANGTSWADATADLQGMINASASGQQVWVAAGTYNPTLDRVGVIPGDNHNRTFLIKSGVSVYGGFVGTEATLTLRNWGANQTILSGEINAVGLTDNVRQVVRIELATANTRLDGFIIRDGYANGDGGGIFIRPNNAETCLATISNCVITNNNANGCRTSS